MTEPWIPAFRRQAAVSLATFLGLGAALLWAATDTGSSAVLAGAIHLLISVSLLALMLYGSGPAVKADAGHWLPGEQAFWAGIGAVLLLALGAGVTLHEGVSEVLRPQSRSGRATHYAVLGAGILIATALAHVVRTRLGAAAPGVAGRRGLAITGLEAATIAQAAGLLAAMAGLAASDLGNLQWADGAAAIGVGLVMASAAALIAVELKRWLTVGLALQAPAATATSPPEAAASAPITSSLAASTAAPALPAAAIPAAAPQTDAQPAPAALPAAPAEAAVESAAPASRSRKQGRGRRKNRR